MKYRDVELYYQQTLDDVGTKIIDLRTTDPISAIRLQFFGTNGGSYCRDNRLNDVITKIELVDGSDQLLSLTLKEAQALEFRRTGKMPYMRPGEKASGGQEESTLILFGRYLWDPEYYMDLTKFRNPQLKITTNIAAVAAASATAFLTGSLKVTIDLHVIQEGAPAAKGFFMAKNIYGFTSGTSGDEHVDMPMDYPYAGLMIRAFVAGNDVNENISKLKLNCDAGKYIPFEKYVKDLWKSEEEDLGPAELRYLINRAHDATVTHDLNHDPIVSLVPVSAGLIANVGWSWSSRFYLSLLTHAGANQTDAVDILMIVKGACPHSTIYVPFGLPNEPATYFDPKVFGDIDLVLTQAAASAVAVVLNQLRPYGAK
jgi:hypothetical protein